MNLTGGCHCGAVRFAIAIDAPKELLDCNCTICARTGHLHLFVAHEDFTLECGEEALTSYRFGSKMAEHLFCKKCGIKSFYQPRSHPDGWSVNYRCLDNPEQVQVSIRKFDGQNWKKSHSSLN